MIHPDIAFEIIDNINYKIEIEEIALSKALNRILAKPLISKIDSPPFNKSAMDGYALPDFGENKRYIIDLVIPAGSLSSDKVKMGHCFPIMTGAPIPNGTKSVIQVEYCSEVGGEMVIQKESRGDNIIYQGENIQKGEEILHPGVINPAHIGIAAASGYDMLPVVKIPRVVILNTGSEISEPGVVLKPGFIYNSNGVQLQAQLNSIFIPFHYEGIVKDNFEVLKEKIDTLSKQFDLIILSGGVSAGKFDFVPNVVDSLGFTTLFHKVGIKPGKPVLLARKGECFVFGLPGNPVSGYVLFEIMIKRLIFRMMGKDFSNIKLKVTLLNGYKRNKASRQEYRPAIVSEEGAFLSDYKGSSHLNGYAQANALICLKQNQTELKKGEVVDAILL